MSLPDRMGALLLLACAMAAPVSMAQAPNSPVEILPAPGGLHDDGYDAFGDTSHVDEDEHAYGPQTDLDAVDAAHAAYLNNRELQLKRPEYDAPDKEIKPRKSPPRWLQAIFDFLDNLGPVFQIIFWAAIVVVALGVLYFLFGEAIRIRFGKSGKGKVDEPDDVLVDLRPDAGAARSLLDEADALARNGQFADAVHLLLFRSIDDIQQRLDGGVPRSLTAREIGGLRNLPERAKRGLGPIIAIVEHSFFGGRDVDESGWKTARDSYEQFAFGEAWA